MQRAFTGCRSAPLALIPLQERAIIFNISCAALQPGTHTRSGGSLPLALFLIHSAAVAGPASKREKREDSVFKGLRALGVRVAGLPGWALLSFILAASCKVYNGNNNKIKVRAAGLNST